MILKEYVETNLTAKKLTKKVAWMKRYESLNFEFPTILLLFLENWRIPNFHIF